MTEDLTSKIEKDYEGFDLEEIEEGEEEKHFYDKDKPYLKKERTEEPTQIDKDYWKMQLEEGNI